MWRIGIMTRLEPTKNVRRAWNCEHVFYEVEGIGYHREDGPALSHVYDNGIITDHGKFVTRKVEPWLNEHGYVWETMSDQEKWELEMFMRSL